MQVLVANGGARALPVPAAIWNMAVLLGATLLHGTALTKRTAAAKQFLRFQQHAGIAGGDGAAGSYLERTAAPEQFLRSQQYGGIAVGHITAGSW